MSDMTAIIQPKSDQMNSDDLMSGPRIITITAVTLTPGSEQPCAVSFAGDNGKPWKPCKSMARVLVLVWGPDSKNYVGKSLTLYRDPDVKWGGMAVGGIRISHMSDMKSNAPLMLTVTRGKKAPYTVKPLADVSKNTPKPNTSDERVKEFDWPKYEMEVDALIFYANDADALTREWDAMKPDRLKARDNDRDRAGKIATRVNDKIKELTDA